MKLTFSCDCADATSSYKVSKTEPEHLVHPFCLSSPSHKWCVGACHNAAGEAEDYPRKQLQIQSKLGTDAADVVSHNATSVEDCHEKAKEEGKDFFDYNSDTEACRTASTRGTYLQQQAVGSKFSAYMRTDSETGCKALNPFNKLFKGNLNPQRSFSMKLRGHVITLGRLSSASKTEVENVASAADCETSAGGKTYYSYNSETEKCISSDDYVVSRVGACRAGDLESCKERVYGNGLNELKMCNAEDGLVDLCDETDSFCHSTPRIDRTETKNLNFDQKMVHASFSSIGKIHQCNYDGDTIMPANKLDRELYPLAPCPSTEQPFYCDFVRNSKFGHPLEIIDYQTNGTTKFTCEPDVTITVENTKIEDGIVSVVASAMECEMTAKNASADSFSYQPTYSVCVKGTDELTGDGFDNELICESKWDQTWTVKEKKECILPRNRSTTVAEAGATVYKIHKRESTGLPDGIREYANGYDKQQLQFSYEHQEPVSAAMAINELSTSAEVVSMNIFTIGRLLKDKIVLTSQQEGSNEGTNNADNANAIKAFFDTMALSGDSVPFSDSQATKPAEAEWFPLEVGGATGVVDKHRCHTVADTTIVDFRSISDVRTEFIDKFFDAADQATDKSPCGTDDPTKYDIAALDDMRGTDNIPYAEQFKRCRNDDVTDNFLYPSLRKSFFNPITADGYRSGFMKGQRFVKEMGRSTEPIGSVSDGTTTKHYYHDKMMIAFSTEQVENCNTEMPDKSGYKILKTRKYPDSPDDQIDGNWGTGYDDNMYERWGTRFCRSTITVSKFGKNPDTIIYQGAKTDASGKYIEKYAYKVEITEQDCSDLDIREEEPIAEGTTAAFNIQEAEEVVRVLPAVTPDWCRTDTGHYGGKQQDMSDGGVCLSHKQLPRKKGLSEDQPYGSLDFSVAAKCVEDNSQTDVTSVYGDKTTCESVVGHTWFDFKGHQQTDSGRCFVKSSDALVEGFACLKGSAIVALNETSCVVGGLGQWLNLALRADCEKYSGYEWDFTDISFGYVASVPNASNPSQFIEKMEWEDSRLSCAHMGTSSGRSKYDRIRLAFFVDVLKNLDLFDEGKVNAAILPRGIPTGIIEGKGSGAKEEACAVCESVGMVGQHKLGGDDLDDSRENVTDLDDQTRKQRYEDGYRAAGYSKNPTETYERIPPGNIQGRQEFNELVQIIDKYVIRDIGTDEAAAGSKPFIDDSLTTISYLGIATNSMDPLVDSPQKLMEDEGDAKIYSRYLVEMFSADCLDRTQPHTHSSHLEIQLFKDGRWPAERLADAETCDGDGIGLDITTTGALSRASPLFAHPENVTVDTKQVCGPIEMHPNSSNVGNLCDNGEMDEKIAMVFKVEQTGQAQCAGAGTPLSGQMDIQQCAALAHAAGFDRIVFVQGEQCTGCNTKGDAGTGGPTAKTHMSVGVSGNHALDLSDCVQASPNHYCQVCSKETFGCELKNESHRLMDMNCAGRDFHDKNAKLGINSKMFAKGGPEDASNLMIVDIPAVEQTRGNFFGAETIEFSIGVSLLDTIEFEEDQYVTLKGMGSRVEMIAWVRNTDLGNSAEAKDVRSMGDLVYPQSKYKTILTPNCNAIDSNTTVSFQLLRRR